MSGTRSSFWHTSGRLPSSCIYKPVSRDRYGLSERLERVNLAFGPGFHRKTVNGRVQICIKTAHSVALRSPLLPQIQSVGRHRPIGKCATLHSLSKSARVCKPTA
jgi:hypothetical protein